MRVQHESFGKSIAQTPVISVGAYTAKDAVGGLLTFANAAVVPGGKGVINTVTIIDHDDEKAALELWLFSEDPTVAVDKDPMDFTDALLLKCVGVVPIATTDYFSLADNGVACLRGVGLQYQCTAMALYGQLKCVATPTYTAATDLTVIIAVEYLD